MHLQPIDWLIAAIILVVCFFPALFFGRLAGRSTSEFFVSGRSVPWWLAGLSMVATTFSSDTPNWVTQQVRQYGVAGNWQWWAFVLSGVATVFFFARLWRRSGVMTDLEFYELRYSGAAASVVRGFRAVYLGLFFNCFIMAMVTLAACKIANILFGLAPWQTIAVCGVLNVIFAAHAGLWGVLVIDMVQFFVKMTAVVAAAYFSLKAVAQHAGLGDSALVGLHTLVHTLGGQQVIMHGASPVASAIDGTGQPYLALLPNFSTGELALMIFIVPVAIGWWANWYPGSEPGGGSYIAQRMLASRSEKDALAGTLFFNLAHYVIRPWPWIITALCSILVFPELKDIQAAFPNADPTLIGHDSAFSAMLMFMPAGFVGLMVGGLIAANSSTILTHLNWGSSYLVHDFYRRFLRPTADERHYVAVGRLCTLVLYVVAACLSRLLESAQDAFEVLISIGAGTGLLYILRWYWWRINAWCEVVAMVSSFSISVTFFLMRKAGHPLPFADSVIYSVAFTTLAWLVTAFVGSQTSRERLVAFYRQVHPSGPGWTPIRIAAGISDAEAAATEDSLFRAAIGWIAGCLTIWSALFGIGELLYGRSLQALGLTAVFAVSAGVLVYTVNTLWTDSRRNANFDPVEAP
ncbi:MAG TPA: sodium:solute symporter family protein [Vicinamibacterales bacterium]|jgi:Na+/proline symporter